MIAIARCRVRVGGPSSGRGFWSVVAADEGAEVADPGLAGRAAFVGAEVGDGVVEVDAAADGGGVGEHVGGVAEQQVFAEPGRDLVAVDRGVVGQVDHRFQLMLQWSPSMVRSRPSSTGPTSSTRAMPVPALRASALRWT